jgi:hypothetical protein
MITDGGGDVENEGVERVDGGDKSDDDQDILFR